MRQTTEEEEWGDSTRGDTREEGTNRTSSTSSLSDAMEAEGEPDDLEAEADVDGDADAEGIEESFVVGYQPGIIGAGQVIDRQFQYQRDARASRRRKGLQHDLESVDHQEFLHDHHHLSRPSRLSNIPKSSKKPLVLKLKLAPPAPTAKRKYVRKAPPSSISKSTPNRSRGSTNDKKNNSKRQNTDEEDDQLAEHSSGINSEIDESEEEEGGGSGGGSRGGSRGGNRSGQANQASEYSAGASTGDDTMSGHVGQLTVRQRAKEFGEAVIELHSLPMGKKKKELTEADRAIERAEKSRKRKHQIEKKLEDEKTETINRLLKGQGGRNGGAKGNNGMTETTTTTTTTTDENQLIKPNTNNKNDNSQTLPTLIRSVSSIKSGEFISCLHLPTSFLNDDHLSFFLDKRQ